MIKTRHTTDGHGQSSISGIGIALAVLFLLAGSARGQFVNGSFETGDYTGWTLAEGPYGPPEWGTWGIAANGQTIAPGDTVFDYCDGVSVRQDALDLAQTYIATDGNFVALQLQNGPQSHRMYQDVLLPLGTNTLSWDMKFANYAAAADLENQVLRVTLRDPGTDAELDELFSSADGLSPQWIEMTTFTASVAGFVGQTVRVSVELIANKELFPAAFDNFRLNIVNLDSDGDGVTDDLDRCPNSILDATVVIDGCDSGVPNTLFADGCTIADLIVICADEAKNHTEFSSCVADLTNRLKKMGVITGAQVGSINNCAARSSIGK